MKQEFDVFVGMKEKWLGDLERISQAAATIEADSAAIAEQQAELERVRCTWAFDLCCVVLCFVCCECPCDWMAQTQTAPPPFPFLIVFSLVLCFFGSLFLRCVSLVLAFSRLPLACAAGGRIAHARSGAAPAAQQLHVCRQAITVPQHAPSRSHAVQVLLRGASAALVCAAGRCVGVGAG